MVFYILSWVLRIEAILMLLPIITAVIYKEHDILYFLVSAAGCALFARLISLRKPKDMKLYTREGFVSVALSWVLLSFFGCMPCTR